MKSYFNILLLVSSIQFAQNIELDNSFGNNGYLTTTAISQISKTLVLADNKTINVGSTIQSGGVLITQLCLFKANANGTIDTTFGVNGYVNTSVENTSLSRQALLQPDNKILVAGYFKTLNGGNSTIQKGLLVRYNTDGSLDTSFGVNGIVKIDLPNTFPNGVINSIALLSNNNIVGLGTNNQGSFILKYNVNGILDTSFGTNGIVFLNFESVNYGSYYITTMTDDSIICGGTAANLINPKTSIIKFNSNGQLVSSFGNSGIKTIDTYSNPIPDFNSLDEYCTKLIIQDDLKILIKGVSGTTNIIFRLLPNGNLDTEFGINGYINFILLSSNFDIQNDGKIILSGSINTPGGDYGFHFSRYNQNGTPDITFNSNGIFEYNPTITQDFLDTFSLQNDGNLIGAGVIDNNGISKVFLTKYLINQNLSDYQFKNLVCSLSPNPTTDNIKITFGAIQQKIKITLQNTLGQIVSSKTFTNVDTVNYYIEGEAGSYLLTIENEIGEKQSHKIIKK